MEHAGRKDLSSHCHSLICDNLSMVMALARQGAGVALADISTRQDISLAYLEQLFVKLRRAGLVGFLRNAGNPGRLCRG